MNTDNSHPFKIDMDSLKSTFRQTRTPATEECPMVDLTIAYALGDPDLDEQSEIKDHIQPPFGIRLEIYFQEKRYFPPNPSGY